MPVLESSANPSFLSSIQAQLKDLVNAWQEVLGCPKVSRLDSISLSVSLTLSATCRYPIAIDADAADLAAEVSKVTNAVYFRYGRGHLMYVVLNQYISHHSWASTVEIRPVLP